MASRENEEEILDSDIADDAAGSSSSSSSHDSELCPPTREMGDDTYFSCSSAGYSTSDNDDDVNDEDIPVREKRIWIITEQQRRTFRRMQRLEAETRQRRLANRHTYRKRTNFGWMKTVGKYPVSWGKKWKPSS